MSVLRPAALTSNWRSLSERERTCQVSGRPFLTMLKKPSFEHTHITAHSDELQADQRPPASQDNPTAKRGYRWTKTAKPRLDARHHITQEELEFKPNSSPQKGRL